LKASYEKPGRNIWKKKRGDKRQGKGATTCDQIEGGLSEDVSRRE